MTIIFYISTFILDKFLTAILSFPLTAIIGKISKSIVFASTIGTIVIYFLYNYLWLEWEGGKLPILMLALLIIGNLAMIKSGKLTTSGTMIARGEIIGQAIFLVYLLFFSNSIRWY